MVELTTDDGHVHHFPDAVVDAISGHAERQAELTAAFLRDCFPDAVDQKVSLPPGTLLELGAILEIEQWERSGIFQHLQGKVPSSAEATKSLVARCDGGLAEFEGDDTSLSSLVLRTWIENFAWDGQSLLDTDLFVDDDHADSLVDDVAEFIWKNRQVLAKLLAKSDPNHET